MMEFMQSNPCVVFYHLMDYLIIHVILFMVYGKNWFLQNTREVLVRRGILEASDALCPLRLASQESVDHLFIYCHN